MIPKKTNKTNLENKRTLFFEYGIIVSLAIALVAFEWGSKEQPVNLYADLGNDIYVPEEMTEITRPEPPELKVPPVPDEIIVIDDNEPIIDDIDIDWSQDIDENTIFELVPYEPEDEVVEPTIFVRVEKMPTYRGGNEAKFQQHVQQLVKYPEKAQELNIQGKVTVQFVVDENGNLTKPTILQSEDPLLSNAVLEALKKTDKWKPGEQRGRKVKVNFTIPVFFRLQ